MQERLRGTVKWFSRRKGFGFIGPDEVEFTDVFVHYSEIRSDGFRNLNEGERVEFAIATSPKGPQAIEVITLSEG